MNDGPRATESPFGESHGDGARERPRLGVFMPPWLWLFVLLREQGRPADTPASVAYSPLTRGRHLRRDCWLAGVLSIEPTARLTAICTGVQDDDIILAAALESKPE